MFPTYKKAIVFFDVGYEKVEVPDDWDTNDVISLFYEPEQWPAIKGVWFLISKDHRH